MRFMIQRADDFHILRRKPIPVYRILNNYYIYKNIFVFIYLGI